MNVTLVFATSAIVALAVAAAVRRVATTLGAVVAPRPNRWHRYPTPTYGGIAVLAGLGAGLLAYLTTPGSLTTLYGALPVLAATAVLFGVGWYDDLRPLSAMAKMVSSLAVASFFVFALTYFEAGVIAPAVSLVAIVWFGGLDNAVNLLDNMDGLAAGVVAIAAVGLAVTFHVELGPGLTMVLVALAGGLCGFLFWNRSPARLFMGNCGSLAIGAVLAGCASVAVLRAGTLTSAIAAVSIVIMPLFDTAFVVLLRRLAGRSTTRGNIDHTSHRLVSAGFSESRAVLILYVVGLVGAAAGYLLHTRGAPVWPVAAFVGVGVLIFGLYLARVPAYGGQEFRALQGAPFAPLLSDLTFRWHAGEVLLDLVLISICYYTAYRVRFEGEALPVFMSTFALSLPAVLGCKLAALYTSGLYSRSWATFGFHDLSTVLRGVALGSMMSVLAATWLYKFERFSRSVFLIDAVLLTSAIIVTRLSFRILARMAARSGGGRRRVMIYGAGARGQMLVRELLANDAWSLDPVGFLDDNDGMRAKRILGVRVHGSFTSLDKALAAHAVDEVLISSPAIDAVLEAQIRRVCTSHEVEVRRLYLDIR